MTKTQQAREALKRNAETARRHLFRASEQQVTELVEALDKLITIGYSVQCGNTSHQSMKFEKALNNADAILSKYPTTQLTKEDDDDR